MKADLEERVATLERQLSDLKKVVSADRREKDWRKTFGMSSNDPGFNEMIRLGAEARRREREEDEG